MSVKPSDFYLNVADFFAVIVPGAVLTAVVGGQTNPAVEFGDLTLFLPGASTNDWVAFLLATYILGHLVFAIASAVMDKGLYDRYLRGLLTRNFDLSYLSATAIRNRYIPVDFWIRKHEESDAIDQPTAQKLRSRKKKEILNTYKWALHYLGSKAPEALAEIKKLEADSKLFRSLTVVFLITAISYLGRGDQTISQGSIVLCLLSIYRYGDLRYKCTERAYELVVVLDSLNLESGTETSRM